MEVFMHYIKSGVRRGVGENHFLTSVAAYRKVLQMEEMARSGRFAKAIFGGGDCTLAVFLTPPLLNNSVG
jgi:hypothetical protein